MAQFDIYKNPSKTTNKFFPYIVDIQSPLINQIATRLVIPLGKYEHFNNQAMTHLTPELTFNNEKLFLFTPQLSSISSNLLESPIGSLSYFRDEIISSVDFAITGI